MVQTIERETHKTHTMITQYEIIQEAIDKLRLSLSFPENYPPEQSMDEAIKLLTRKSQSCKSSILNELKSAVSDIEYAIQQLEK